MRKGEINQPNLRLTSTFSSKYSIKSQFTLIFLKQIDKLGYEQTAIDRIGILLAFIKAQYSSCSGDG
jgi:hypothetical protein